MKKRSTIGLSEEQAQLLDIAASFCAEKSPVTKVRSLIEDELGYDPAVWNEIAELGWLGIAVPEEFGGIGLGLAEAVPVVEQMGRALMAGPFVPTTLAAQALLTGGTDAQKSELLPKLCAGAPASLALIEDHGDWDLTHIEAKAEKKDGKLVLSGKKFFVLDAPSVDHLIVSVSLDGKPALVILGKNEVKAAAPRRETVIDETRRSYQLTLDGVSVPESALMDQTKAAAALAHVELCASLLLSAEMCGGAKSVIDYTVDYLKTRKQFGKLIGSYQSLKHPIVDAHVAYEQARSHLYSAAWNFTSQGEGELGTRMAKAVASEAFAFASDRAIQFHGGFGFTYECDAQLYRRRALWNEYQHGDAVHHRRLLADKLVG